MRTDAAQLNEKDEVYKLAGRAMRNRVYAIPPDDISLELYCLLSLGNVGFSIENIFRYATNDTEKNFLSAVLICSLVQGDLLLRIEAPFNFATEEIKRARDVYSQVMLAWKKFQVNTGKTSMNSFIEYLYAANVFSEEQKMVFEQNMMMKILDHYRSYIFSIKSTFGDIKIRDKYLETNMLVWSIAQPDFKLLIECDRFDYQTDKSAFSDDRARDRYLQSLGFQIFRFSGSEIMEDPMVKAQELVNYLIRKQQ